MQCKTKTQNTNTNAHKSTHSEIGQVQETQSLLIIISVIMS